MSQLRIALTLPGEASLGAFQAGAVSALLVAVQRINVDRSDAVRVDVMTGTSSGSLTAVLAGHALLMRQDPVEPLRRAWVMEPTIGALLGRDARAPLTLNRAREVATELLSAHVPAAAPPGAQTHPIVVSFALTSLRGFTYTIQRSERRAGAAGIGQREPELMRATTHLDWAEHTLTSRTDWPEVVDSAIASASHPAAFPPALLDRGGQQTDYERNGVENFPRCPALWYADGGLLDREPVGRCIKVARTLDDDNAADGRLVLLIRPEPDVGLAPDDPAWTEDADPPSWTTTLARALRIIVTHSLYEDLRRVERVNSRIAWRQMVTDELAGLIPHDDETRDKLRDLVRKIRDEKGRLRAGVKRRGEDLEDDVAGLLGQLLDEATGLAGKHEIAVEVVSAHSATDVAGGSLLNFGGFLAERLRANDFLVGYMAMLTWMSSRAGKHFAGPGLEAAEARGTTIPGWIGGAAGRQRLSWRARADALRIAGRAARIGVRRGGAPPRV